VEEQVAERRHGGDDRLVVRTDGPAHVVGDEPQLGRLLRNLLDNALRYSDGKVQVVVSNADAVTVEVIDDGPGIAPADRSRVFERFTRLDDARDRDAGGTGLGLAIARDIASSHGGAVEIGEARTGTRVVVRLPRPAPPDLGPAPAGKPPRAAAAVGRRVAGVAAVLAVLVGATMAASGRVPGRDPNVPDAFTRGGGSLVWVGAADGMHVFRLTTDCPQCGTTTFSVSTDGGLTWVAVATTALDGNVQLLGPSVLLATTLPAKRRPGAIPRSMVSYDGGRHWTAPVLGAPIDAAPAGAAVFCWPTPYAGLMRDACALHVADPRSRRIRPLSSVPPLTAIEVNTVPVSAGVWVSGVDPATKRPALSVSHDGGRTWSTHVISELPPVTVEGGHAARIFLPDVASVDGRAAYGVIFDNGWRAFTTHDGVDRIDWTSLEVEKTTNVGGPSFVTTDGTHVLAIDGGIRYLARGEGDLDYRPIALGGVPFYAVVTMLPGGGYLAHTDSAIYRSDDGWAWRLVWQE
jgi:hypothetical protein